MLSTTVNIKPITNVELLQNVVRTYEAEVKGCIAENLKSRSSNYFILQIDFLKTSKGIEFTYCPNSIDIITNSEPSKGKIFYGIDKVAKKIRTEIRNMDNS